MTIMSKAKPVRYYQAPLPLPGKSLWERLPEPTRDQCRKALVELLQQVVLREASEIDSHE
jgi:hypothetical protein